MAMIRTPQSMMMALSRSACRGAAAQAAEPFGGTVYAADSTAFAAPPTAYFYLIQVVDVAGQAYPASNRAGAFGFTLTPGSGF